MVFMKKSTKKASDSVFTQQKAIRARAGSVKRLGDIYVQLNTDEKDQFLSGSTMSLDISITIETRTKVNFDEIRVGLKEIQSWTSLVESKNGNSPLLTETTKLAKETVKDWTERQDETNNNRRVIHLKNIELKVPESTSSDREVGLVRVHHFLDIKLISHGRRVGNLNYKFPIVIGGGDQYTIPPDRHPMHIKQTPDKILAAAIAGAIKKVTRTTDYCLEAPGRAAKQLLKSM
jgi:hypothetical protein